MSTPRNTREAQRDISAPRDIREPQSLSSPRDTCKALSDITNVIDEASWRREERNMQQRKRRAEISIEQRDEINRKQREYWQRKKAATQNSSTSAAFTDTLPLTSAPSGSGETEMDGGDGSPVMTDSDRRAYRYGHRASPRLPGMRKSWSNDSLAGYSGYGGGGRASCVCAPTTHPGSFRCKHHRHASNLSAAAAAAQIADEAPAADADADAKHHEQEAQQTAPAADQADKSA